MITIYEEVGEAKIEESGVTLVGSLQVFDASDHGDLAVDGYLQLGILFGAFHRKRFSFASRLGCAKSTANGVVSDPAGEAEHHANSELSWIITQQEMKFLEVAAFKREIHCS